MFVPGAIPELFEVVQLLLAHGLLECPGNARRRLHPLGRIVKVMMRLILDLSGLVGLKDAALAFLEHGDEGFETGTKAADLAGIDANGAGQFLLSEAARVAVEEQVLEGG